jgi:leader peptidase (prepilin peptidase)/N-methyltransferase
MAAEPATGSAVGGSHFENGLRAAAASAAFLAAIVLSPTAAGAVTGVALAALMLCALIDYASFRIPNVLTYGGLVLVLAASLLLGDGSPDRAAFGALLGGGLMLVLCLFSRGALGFGDAKLSAFGGALVGGEYVLQALLVGAVAAAVVCLPLVLLGKLRRNQPVPFGPFLSLGFALVCLTTATSLATEPLLSV